MFQPRTIARSSPPRKTLTTTTCEKQMKKEMPLAFPFLLLHLKLTPEGDEEAMYFLNLPEKKIIQNIKNK
jgi:hypothetical protein